MIGNNQFRTFYPGTMNNGNTAQQIKQYIEMAARRKQMGLEGDGADPGSFAAKLKQADENLASGQSFGTTDSIDLILRQMEEPERWPVTKMVSHNGVSVAVTKDSMKGVSINIGGSKDPDPIHVKTSVGTVTIDLNDTKSVMKCLDLFSPEDVTAILREITKANQLRNAGQELADMEDELTNMAQDVDKADE